VNQQILTYLPVLSPIMTLLVVYIGVLAQNRHVDMRVSDLQRHMDQRFTDTLARIDALTRARSKTQHADGAAAGLKPHAG